MQEAEKYQITINTWNKLASVYEEKFMDLDLYDDSYDMFCKLITQANPTLLEIGSGPGNITRYLIEKLPGLSITATDVAPNMVALTQKNNPVANTMILDCRQIRQLDQRFDGIVCGFCIPYLSKVDCKKFIGDCAGLLEPGGAIYLSCIEGRYEDSKFESGSTGDQAYVYYYEEDFLKNELIAQGYKLVHLLKKNFKKADGSTQVHLIYIAQKER